MIIGLCGKAGSGKDTVGGLLAGRGFETMSFADPLYQAVSAITGLPVEQMKDRSIKETPIPWLGKSPRELLQTLGTEWGRNTIHSELWVMRCMNRCFGIPDVVITDVRFDNEAVAIRANGGVVVQIVRGAAGLDGETAVHASEAGVSDALIHEHIPNEGTLDDLASEVNALLCRLRRREHRQ
jgi:hypothetical protein